MSSDFVARLHSLDSALVGEGWHETSPWWWGVVARMFGGAFRRVGVVRVGRRGGKSSTLCRIAVAWALWGDWHVPPGDVGTVCFVSVGREDSAARIRTCEEILNVLGFTPTRIDPGEKEYVKRSASLWVRLNDRVVVIKTVAATVAGVSGFTCVMAIGDEVAKWRDTDTKSNPATEVIRSFKPTMATVPQARMFLISSPWATNDAHHEAFERGDTAGQAVFYAPTWEANPSLSEADTKALEEDPATWEREYKAIPMSSGGGLWFDSEAIKRALIMPAVPPAAFGFGADFAFSRNSSALVGACTDFERVGITEVHEQRPAPGQPLKPSLVVSDFARVVHQYGAEDVAADGHYREAIVEYLDESNLELVDAPGGVHATKPWVRARVLLNSGRLSLKRHAKLLTQLQEARGVPLSGGTIRIDQPLKATGEHGDIASAMMLAIWRCERAQKVGAADNSFRVPSRWTLIARHGENRPKLLEYPDHSDDLA